MKTKKRFKQIKEFFRNQNLNGQRGEILVASILGCAAVLGVLLYTNFDENKFVVQNASGDILNEKEIEIKLPTFNNKKEIIDKIGDGFGNYITPEYDVIFEASSSVADSATNGTENKVSDLEYSTTNTQVKGVDEADIVKTNGNFIYYISNGKLYIFDTKTPQTKLIKTIEITSEYDYYPQELYIDENYITVIAQEYVNRDEIEILPAEEGEIQIENPMTAMYDTIVGRYISRYSNYTNVTAMHVYDINTFELVKLVETEGSYVSSRKIDNNIYMVTNRYLYSGEITEDNILPIYKEASSSTMAQNCEADFVEISAKEIKYFPDIEEEKECNYMIITSIDLSKLEGKAMIDTYLGAGTEIYCSKENLYVVKVEYKRHSFREKTAILMIDSVETEDASSPNVTTKIHKFKLLDGSVKYVATGEVAGSLLNQYSMDENNNYFRITTTSNMGNSLYVLNSELEEVGKLENLAKGEKIYATRFMGDKCYLVTYKTVDPLFVIDLSNPENPTVLGELKIPGYSTYLHPLDENLLIGFGEDSVEKRYINWEGNEDVIAYNTGMKLAIFDISDLNNPKELHSIKIGGRGSSSELLNNPKVLYFNKEEGIFAFPARLTEETKFYEDGTPMYGDTVFQGALVYNLSVEYGISLRGTVEHKTLKELNYYKNSGYQIERILSIKDNFYTISPNMIKVTNMDTMKEIEEGTCEFGKEGKELMICY